MDIYLKCKGTLKSRFFMYLCNHLYEIYFYGLWASDLIIITISIIISGLSGYSPRGSGGVGVCF